MSTHSGIGILNKDGTVTSVYCHNDGYPRYMLSILKMFYNTEEKARALIDLGYLSSVQENFWAEGHSFDHPVQNTTVVYHRDRGEDYKQDNWDNLDEYKTNAEIKYFADYLYWFENNEWHYI